MYQLIIIRKFADNDNNDVRQKTPIFDKVDVTFIKKIGLMQKQIKRIPWIKQKINAKKEKTWTEEFKVLPVEDTKLVIAQWSNMYLIKNNEKILIEPISAHIINQFVPILHGPQES
ncbi:hypothetical protein [Sodalis sp. CWE]|uniref:hypothetical protein n=1 Tax=Sodalis sp. CWE TaxID=2803816 RepID=UPI001C7D5168|nr:hypothetical protein [Sodalis sp. CWE]MBX4180707.1 hypothetical protein [Sodalis sp. CWE]